MRPEKTLRNDARIHWWSVTSIVRSFLVDATVRVQPGFESPALSRHVSFIIKTIANSAIKNSFEVTIFFMTISTTYSMAADRVKKTFLAVYLFDTMDTLY